MRETGTSPASSVVARPGVRQSCVALLYLAIVAGASGPSRLWAQTIDPELWGVDNRVFALTRVGDTLYVGGAFRGGGLLFLYSLGLGLPFLLIGLGLKRLMRALDVIKRNYHWFAGVSGVIMVAIGVLLVSGLWQSWVTPWLNSLSRITPPL